MKVTVHEAGPCRKILQVSASAEEIEPTFAEVVSQFMRFAQIRGFRPGKAPRPMVERQYASHIQEEAESRLLPQFYRMAIREQKITPVAVVNMTDTSVSRREGLTFRVTVDVPPDFKLPKYDRIVLDDQKTEITDEQVSEALAELQERLGRFEDAPDAAVETGHMIAIDYTGACEGVSLEALASKHPALVEGKDFWMLVGQRELLPGFSDALRGARAGETRKIVVTFPGDYQVAEVAGCQAAYTATVRQIRERRRLELGPDLFKRCGVETEEALRDAVRKDLNSQAEQEERMRKLGEIQRKLLEETRFDVPQSVVAQETNITLRGMVRNIVMEGGSRETIEQNREQIAGEAERISGERVRLSYILHRIAEQEAIDVDDEEVDARIAALAAGYNIPPARLRAELIKKNGLDGVRSDIRSDKVLNWLLEKAVAKS